MIYTKEEIEKLSKEETLIESLKSELPSLDYGNIKLQKDSSMLSLFPDISERIEKINMITQIMKDKKLKDVDPDLSEEVFRIKFKLKTIRKVLIDCGYIGELKEVIC